jgi:hypothetical protein
LESYIMSTNPESLPEPQDAPKKPAKKKVRPPIRSALSDVVTTFTYDCSSSRARDEPAWTIEHDPKKGVFRLTDPDGVTAVFRNKALRYLVLNPDPETGELAPVVLRGQPLFWYLCLEKG